MSERPALTLTFAGILLLFSTAHASTGSDEFTFEKLVETIESQHRTDLAGALSTLPREMRSNYLLMAHSESSQGASPEAPRVILFGRNSKLILAFNGDPAEAGYQRLEAIQFRDDSEEFEFRTITFGKTVEVSPANPPSCQGCHRRQPIWGAYRRWPGSYGGEDDLISDRLQPLFIRWAEGAQHHDRYRVLERGSYKFFPYATEAPIKGAHLYRPADRLMRNLLRLDGRRLANLVVRSVYFGKHRYSSLLWLANCQQAFGEKRLARAKDDFAKAFPVDRFRELHERASHIQSPDLRQSFYMERLLTGSEVGSWSMERTAAPGERFYGLDPSLWEDSLDFWVASRVFESVSGDPKVHKHIVFTPYETVYSRVTSSRAYDLSMGPGDVGKIYDSLGYPLDPAKIKGACGTLARASERE